MSEIGRLAIVLGFLVALWGIGASVVGGLRRNQGLIASGMHAAYAFSALTGIAVLALLQLLLARDFNVEYVASYSSSTLPLQYVVIGLGYSSTNNPVPQPAQDLWIDDVIVSATAVGCAD